MDQQQRDRIAAQYSEVESKLGEYIVSLQIESKFLVRQFVYGFAVGLGIIISFITFL
jgi:hypothetical protein